LLRVQAAGSQNTQDIDGLFSDHFEAVRVKRDVKALPESFGAVTLRIAYSSQARARNLCLRQQSRVPLSNSAASNQCQIKHV
jgi:hypothetical protein